MKFLTLSVSKVLVCFALNYSLFANANPGALIKVQMNSTVGVVLSDFPPSIKERVIAEYLKKPEKFWKDRANLQIETTLYRLIYRSAFYNYERGRLALPPKELWNVQVTKPEVITIDSHQMVAVNYTFASVIISSADSVKKAEPNLVKIGGTWKEAFLLPADPEYLFERTGYACMDEHEFPVNSVDSENARNFYDHSCVGGKNICHITQPYPKDSCEVALKNRVGRIRTSLNFERVAWDESLAKKYRFGIATSSTPDLAVLGERLKNNRLIYRYIPKDSCAIEEKCVGGSGWRRLLQFDASVANLGRQDLKLGQVEDDSILVKQNMFEHSACHNHYHFSHYGDFTFGSGNQKVSSKRAFCLESTSRYSNNENTPLSHEYNCHNQGIAAGWGDDYIAGIECQWMDVTEATSSNLGFEINPDQFLCEGAPNLDSNNNFTFVPTEFKTESGEIQNRISCEFSDRWNSNNFQSQKVKIPKTGSYVTAPCTRGEDSPIRNCGFFEEAKLRSCVPGQKVKMNCKTQGTTPTVLRICEGSRALKSGTACTYLQSLNNSVIEAEESSVEFTCPTKRDEIESGGRYALYSAPAFVGDQASKISCRN